MKAFFLRLIQVVLGWFLAGVTTIIIGVVFQTQNVISRLGDIGANVSLAERLSMTGYDIHHLGSFYGVFILIAFIVAFLAGGVVFHFAKLGRPVIYVVAGAIAILVMLFAIKAAFFDVHLIAGARDSFGISLQMLAGAIGGWVFAQVSQKRGKS